MGMVRQCVVPGPVSRATLLRVWSKEHVGKLGELGNGAGWVAPAWATQC